MEYEIEDLNYRLNLKKTDNVSITRYLKLSLKKRKEYERLGLFYDLLHDRNCINCESCMNSEDFVGKWDIQDDRIKLIGSYHKLDRPYGDFMLCSKCKKEKLTGLNPNSVDFLISGYAMNYEEAIEVIHSRNSSPFYHRNHESKDAYRDYQNLNKRLNKKERLEQLEKWNKTYYSNKEKFIKENGYDKWKEYCSLQKDTSSLSFFILKYGEELGRIKFQEKIEKTSRRYGRSRKEDFELFSSRFNVNNKEELFEEIRLRSSDMTSISLFRKCQNFVMGKADKVRDSLWTMGFEIFSISKNEIWDCLDICENEISFYTANFDPEKRYFSYYCSLDGFFFRSAFEYDFYIKIKDCVKVLDTNQRYPDSKFFYDFYIEYKGKVFYIELASDLGDAYEAKQKVKNDIFGSIIIQSKYVKYFLEDIKKGNSIEENKYHEIK